MKTISKIIAVIFIVFTACCAYYAYNHQMWYEMVTTIGAGIILVFLCHLMSDMKLDED